MDDKSNFEIAVRGEYCDEVKNVVEKILEEKLPDYTREKTLIIRMIDTA